MKCYSIKDTVYNFESFIKDRLRGFDQDLTVFLFDGQTGIQKIYIITTDNALLKIIQQYYDLQESKSPDFDPSFHAALNPRGKWNMDLIQLYNNFILYH